MPKSVDGHKFGQRMQKAIGSKAQLKFIAQGTHSLSKALNRNFWEVCSLLCSSVLDLAIAGIKPPYLYSCT